MRTSKKIKIIALLLLPLLFAKTISMAQVRYNAPGVYVEEVSLNPANVEEVKSAVPAFIGYTEKATARIKNDLLFIPKKIASLLDYERYFGGAPSAQSFVLYPSLQLYFDNGGEACYIVSIGDYSSTLEKLKFVRGLDAIGREDEPTLLLFPDAVNLPSTGLYEVQKVALQQAEKLKDRFCILDLKLASTAAEHAIVVQEFRDQTGINSLKFGAVYSPHLISATVPKLTLPPSAAVAGQYCRVDNARGVWKAPANVSLNNVSNVAYQITAAEQEGLNIDPVAGKSINVIKRFSGKGILIWGARTLAGNDNEWKYVPVRRFFNMVQESITKSMQVYLFEPNDPNTWTKVKTTIDNYLSLKWRDGAILGSKPSQAFYVRCGLNETMTAADIANKNMIVEIGIAPVKPAEFIIIRLNLKMQQ